MKTLYFCVMVALAVSLAISSSTFAGTQDGAVIALHARAHTTNPATLCTTWKPTIPCSEYNVDWPLGSGADVYLVVAQAPDSALGISGVSCGIDYYGAAAGVGVDVHGWTLCADLEFTSVGANGEWPAAGGGNRITWLMTTNCQRTVIAPDGVHAVAGAFYLFAYSRDFFSIIPNLGHQIPELAVADCNASLTNVRERSNTGWVFFGVPSGCDGGCNPCLDNCGIWCSPVERSTWGAIKRAY